MAQPKGAFSLEVTTIPDNNPTTLLQHWQKPASKPTGNTGNTTVVAHSRSPTGICIADNNSLTTTDLVGGQFKTSTYSQSDTERKIRGPGEIRKVGHIIKRIY